MQPCDPVSARAAANGVAGSTPSVVALATLMLFAGAGCARDRVDVVWVVVDALPAWATSPYGGPEDVTPHLESLADEGILIRRAVAQAPSTLPSTASFLTGVYPDRAVPEVQARALPLISERLREAGYRTAAFSENPWITAGRGFDAGFEVFEEIASPAGQPPGHRDTAATVEAALDWLLDGAREPAFLYLHLLPPHAPYAPPEPYRGMLTDPDDSPAGETVEQLIDGTAAPARALAVMLAAKEGRLDVPPHVLDYMKRRFLENVAYADRLIGRIRERIDAAGRSERTLLVVGSDHGEAFGPHPQLFHGSTLHSTQIRVPLVLAAPASLELPSGRRTEGVAELVDLVPTLLELAGVEPGSGLDGRSLVPWLRGEAPPPEVGRAFLDERQAVVAEGWKLIRRPTGTVLFRRSDDPFEQHDRADELPERVASLEARLLERDPKRVAVETPPLSREAIDELRALGYAVVPDAPARPAVPVRQGYR